MKERENVNRQQTGVTACVGAQAEIHSPSPYFSIFVNTGGTLTGSSGGSVSF